MVFGVILPRARGIMLLLY